MNILLTDNNTIFLDGLIMILEKFPLIKSIDTAKNTLATQTVLKSKSIDLAIIDLNLEKTPNEGVELCKYIRKEYPAVKIIVLTGYLKIDYIESLFYELQIEGYLGKDVGKAELQEAIRVVSVGGRYLDEKAKKFAEKGRRDRLSKREIEILDLLSKGYIKKEIAEKLKLSPHTIRRHVENLLIRMEVNNSVELVSKFNQYLSAHYEYFETP